MDFPQPLTRLVGEVGEEGEAAMGEGGRTVRARSTRDDRRTDLLAHASRALLAQGGLPLSFEQLAGAAGVSKALIYNYFPSQFHLGKALLAAEIARLDREELRRLSALADPAEAALACSLFYFDTVAERGPILRMLLTDPLLAKGASRCLAVSGAGILLLPLVRRARSIFAVSAREANILVHLLLTLAEEGGKQVHQGSIAHARARELCAATVAATFAALREDPAPGAPFALGADFL